MLKVLMNVDIKTIFFHRRDPAPLVFCCKT